MDNPNNTPYNQYSERIWSYLDKDMTDNERVLFESDLVKNPSLAETYKEHSILHQSMAKVELDRAPDTLAEMVMGQINPQATTTALSFSRVKYLGAGMILICLVLLIVAFLEGSNNVVANPIAEYVPLADQYSKITTTFSGIDWSSKAPIILTGTFMLMLYSLDQLSSLSGLKKAKV